MADGPCRLLTLHIPRSCAPVALTLWNYNRPNCETLGLRQISLFVDSQSQPCWQGELHKVQAILLLTGFDPDCV